MDILFEESFEKDLVRIKEDKIKAKVRQIISEVKQIKNQQEIRNLKKLKNYTTYYRIRVGDYRIGVEIVENKIIFVRLLHRKDIYKYFPR